MAPVLPMATLPPPWRAVAVAQPPHGRGGDRTAASGRRLARTRRRARATATRRHTGAMICRRTNAHHCSRAINPWRLLPPSTRTRPTADGSTAKWGGHGRDHARAALGCPTAHGRDPRLHRLPADVKFLATIQLEMVKEHLFSDYDLARPVKLSPLGGQAHEAGDSGGVRSVAVCKQLLCSNATLERLRKDVAMAEEGKQKVSGMWKSSTGCHTGEIQRPERWRQCIEKMIAQQMFGGSKSMQAKMLVPLTNP